MNHIMTRDPLGRWSCGFGCGSISRPIPCPHVGKHVGGRITTSPPPADSGNTLTRDDVRSALAADRKRRFEADRAELHKALGEFIDVDPSPLDKGPDGGAAFLTREDLQAVLDGYLGKRVEIPADLPVEITFDDMLEIIEGHAGDRS